MKGFSILLSIALLSLPVSVLANKQNHLHKSATKKCTSKRLKTSSMKPRKLVTVAKSSQRIKLRQVEFEKIEPASSKVNQLNGLPNSKLDSFILNSGGLSEAIYGDEGNSGPPPYFGSVQLNPYEFQILPSFWSEWKPLYGDFDYTLHHQIERDQVEE